MLGNRVSAWIVRAPIGAARPAAPARRASASRRAGSRSRTRRSARTCSPRSPSGPAPRCSRSARLPEHRPPAQPGRDQRARAAGAAVPGRRAAARVVPDRAAVPEPGALSSRCSATRGSSSSGLNADSERCCPTSPTCATTSRARSTSWPSLRQSERQWISSGAPYWIFDMDGTLTVAVHDFDAIRAELGLRPSEPILEQLARGARGRERARCWRGSTRSSSRSRAGRAAADGAHALLERARARGARLGIVTRNSFANALETLRACGLARFFAPECVLGREAAAPKPDPEGIHRLLGPLARRAAPGRDGRRLPLRPARRPRGGHRDRVRRPSGGFQFAEHADVAVRLARRAGRAARRDRGGLPARRSRSSTRCCSRASGAPSRAGCLHGAVWARLARRSTAALAASGWVGELRRAPAALLRVRCCRRALATVALALLAVRRAPGRADRLRRR